MQKRLSIQEYQAGILEGNRVILSKAITLVESTNPSDIQLAQQLLEKIIPHSGNSFRVGITGVPGVGKSTFIESLGEFLISKGYKPAVLAIDPSSQRTKGSIMGDKTRMDSLSINPNAYIRPSATGSSLGGVANKTRESILLCEAAGYDYILVETVGVGQSEVAVKNITDFFLLLMLAGAGDELQGVKKGIMEMADMIAITKADGDNVEKSKMAKAEYENALHLFPMNENGWLPQVEICSALKKTGLDKIWEQLEKYRKEMTERGFIKENRKHQNKHWFEESLKEKVLSEFLANEKIQQELKSIESKIPTSTFNVSKEVERIFEKYKKGN